MHIALSCICIVTALNFLDNSMIGPDVIASIRLEGTSPPVRYISSASSKLNAPIYLIEDGNVTDLSELLLMKAL